MTSARAWSAALSGLMAEEFALARYYAPSVFAFYGWIFHMHMYRNDPWTVSSVC